MLNHMKSLIINEVYSNNNLNELIDVLYKQSCMYVSSKIHSVSGRERFQQTSIAIRDIIKSNFYYDNYNSFHQTKKEILREKIRITNQYELRDFLEKILFEPRVYDDMAFDIATELLDKIKTRFYDGYVG